MKQLMTTLLIAVLFVHAHSFAFQVDTSMFLFGREFNNHKYYLSKQSKSWHEAKLICEQNGGHLVTITSQAENDTVWQVADLDTFYAQWIGLSDSVDEGQWEWVNEDSVSYTNWQSGEPNNQGDEDYGVFRNDNGEWWDAGGPGTTFRFILEVEELIAYYPFNGNANDESGNGNDGIVNGATTTVDRFGQNNQAYYFNGSSNYIEVPNSASLNPDKIAISLWLYYQGGSRNPRVFQKSSSGDQNAYALFEQNEGYSAALVQFRKDGIGSPNFTFAENFTLNQWQHFVVERDLDSVRIYLNNELVLSEYYEGLLEGNSSPLYFGVHGGTIGDGDYLQGILDDIRIYNRPLSRGEIASLYDNYVQQIISISDIPNDQGGKVRINWSKIYLDEAGQGSQTTAYGVWRRIPVGGIVTKSPPSALAVANDTLGSLYDYLGSVAAVQSDEYNFVASTLRDSSDETYLITAHTVDPNVYYISSPGFGHSLDNLPPAIVTFLSGANVSSTIELEWIVSNVEDDLKEYEIHRSTVDNFVPDGGSEIGQTTSGSFIDIAPVIGAINYYRVIPVDQNNRKGDPSPQAVVPFPVTSLFSICNSWNIVSVPLAVPDYQATTVFPTAVSNAFAYENGYTTETILGNGRGYWLKFGGTQQVAIQGLLRSVDTIRVVKGWNLIGTISEDLNASFVESDPGGLVVSQFFGYNCGGYLASDLLESGKGYWVKVSDPGTLILSPNNVAKSSARVTIVPTNEFPPLPPNDEHRISNTPDRFSLDQNYPNPFNPGTTIRFGLPAQSQVKLEIYNMLGQRVALLLNESKDAGYHEVQWNASNVPSGLYLYRLTFGDGEGLRTDIKKMILMK